VERGWPARIANAVCGRPLFQDRPEFNGRAIRGTVRLREMRMARTVFIVDEDLDGRTALADTLDDEGMRPILFRDPRRAVASLAAIQPALIVTDLWRPGSSAAAPFAALLATARQARLPLIVWSGWTRRAAGRDLAFPFVPKPEIRALLRSIRTAVAQPARATVEAA
jgi:DNA-binding NtrC family response regulator